MSPTPIPFNPVTAAASLSQQPGQSTLQVSGNTSGTAYLFWTETWQSLAGWWERKWEFNHNDLEPSTCGTIAGSYIVYHMHETVTTLQGDNTFASGLTTLHDINYFSDAVSGGWGTSGQLYTVSAGYTRVSGLVGTAGVCNKEWDATGMYIPGQYDLNSDVVDTSAYWNATFNQEINYDDCTVMCDNWRPDIVII